MCQGMSQKLDQATAENQTMLAAQRDAEAAVASAKEVINDLQEKLCAANAGAETARLRCQEEVSALKGQLERVNTQLAVALKSGAIVVSAVVRGVVNFMLC